jgi:hypothetical protein
MPMLHSLTHVVGSDGAITFSTPDASKSCQVRHIAGRFVIVSGTKEESKLTKAGAAIAIKSFLKSGASNFIEAILQTELRKNAA